MWTVTGRSFSPIFPLAMGLVGVGLRTRPADTVALPTRQPRWGCLGLPERVAVTHARSARVIERREKDAVHPDATEGTCSVTYVEEEHHHESSLQSSCR